MNGLCLILSILYQATIKHNDSKYKKKRKTNTIESVKLLSRNVIQSTKIHST